MNQIIMKENISLDEFSTQVSSFCSSQYQEHTRKSNSLATRCYYRSKKKLNHDVISTNTLCRFLFSYLLRVTIDKQARSVRTISFRLL